MSEETPKPMCRVGVVVQDRWNRYDHFGPVQTKECGQPAGMAMCEEHANARADALSAQLDAERLITADLTKRLVDMAQRFRNYEAARAALIAESERCNTELCGPSR